MKLSKIMLITLVAFSLTASALVSAANKKVITGVVNSNNATWAELMILPGIGKSKAQEIIDCRNTQPFKKTEDIVGVKGIGEKLYASLAPYLTVSGKSTAADITPPKPKSAPGGAGKTK